MPFTNVYSSIHIAAIVDVEAAARLLKTLPPSTRRQWWGLRIRLWKILKAVAASKGLLLVCSLLPSAVRTRQSARQRPLPLLVLFRALPTGILELSRDRRAKCGLTETISLSFDGEKESPFFLCGMLGRIVAAAFYLSYYRLK